MTLALVHTGGLAWSLQPWREDVNRPTWPSVAPKPRPTPVSEGNRAVSRQAASTGCWVS